MTKIHRQRDIIDRRAVMARLTELAGSDINKMKRRAGVLAVFKEALNLGRIEVRRRFDQHGDGTQTVRENCFLIDQLVRIVHDFAAGHELPQNIRTSGEAMSLVAVGGYGRGELSPQSDIDLLFLTPYKRTPWHEQVVEYVLYMLWDMGLKVGQSTRSADECIRMAKADLTIRTALLEMRWLWGDQDLYFDLKNRYVNEIITGTGEEFVEAKLAERDARHANMGDTRYVLEPNVKEGKGGLRDLHTLYWLARYLYRVDGINDLVDQGIISKEACKRFAKAQAFLWTVRCHLHYVTERAEDRLTFDVQQEIASRMNYTDHAGSRGVERFMKHFFLVAKDVGDLTRLFCSLAEEQQKRKPRMRLGKLLFLKRSNVDGFVIDGDRLNVSALDQFTKDPAAMIRLFHTSLEHGIDIHPHALDLVHRNLKHVGSLRKDKAANALFMSILTSKKNPEVALRHMNEAGVLSRFIPDFGRVVAQMQYDMYHVYTVDEHTIQAIGILHAIEQGVLVEEAPLSTQIIHKVSSRKALYMAVLLHDIAKGRGGDHSVLGADVAMKLGPRFGLTDEETETVAWLVREHLTMSRVAFKRDVDDPQTITDFVTKVQSPERLRLLLVLTVADIRAVGPNVWNGWKGGLLRELYQRSEELMLGGMAAARDHRVKAAQAAVSRELIASGWPQTDIDAHLARGYPTYWTSFDTRTHVHHARLVRDAEQRHAPLTVESRIDSFRSVTEINVYTSDHPGLFSQIAGAMAVSGANIVDAKIVTLANGMALDSFWIQESDGAAFDTPSKLAKLSTVIEQVLSGRMRLDKELAARKGKLPARAHVFKVPPRVIIDNKASSSHTLIEVNGRDRPGLLYDLTAAMTQLGLQIASAHISTYGERVVDVFYVKDIFGLKVQHERKLEQIRDGVLKALRDPADSEAAAAQ
ncbi:[protein-PII] uridylyltransferase [Magnetospirillum gryphiswaldense]|uniref:Bifunctional uridylyltransferase/uridylyl-removing enzyme n=1 Tax=Magnetospirillum gryphiswaldense TaxID=55518 RepID=A4U2Z6_9PROT|nr:[protein-PII] uridylyltransferase [Magnetospirillum gryphiswaldense]AVM75403.1 Bifunctional uridylyltransferase/uridylyl-removing enzyme [Magnetospirillum gryphiswaldense MSR-1]AVM79306.1 Bifunctional uridylyltransferase/uridylyl-removing enzyme [Magnetospirillum gryphiswaldense]CAM77253.1 Protein-P-II uridylyltransferase [Magnetospirillum gryphiswaldense MSR-1]